MNMDSSNRGIDESESRERLINSALIALGLGVAAVMIVLARSGFDWLTQTAWSKITLTGWLAILFIVCIILPVQYYLLVLLRHRILKHIFWLLPAAWLFLNGLIVIQRLMESEAGEALTGWLPLTDLVGWLLCVAFFPLLIGAGAIMAIIDSTSIVLSQACQSAELALTAAAVGDKDPIPRLFSYLDVFAGLISDSFRQQVAVEHATARPFLDFGSSGLFNLPYWFFKIGYNFSCMAV